MSVSFWMFWMRRELSTWTLHAVLGGENGCFGSGLGAFALLVMIHVTIMYR